MIDPANLELQRKMSLPESVFDESVVKVENKEGENEDDSKEETEQKEEKEDETGKVPDDSPLPVLISNGHTLYALHPANPKSNESGEPIKVSQLALSDDGSTFVVVRSVELKFKFKNNSPLNVFRQWQFFTNGSRIVCYSAGDANTFDCSVFGLKKGQVISASSIQGSDVVPKVCYDVFNNAIFGLSSSNLLRWNNKGLPFREYPAEPGFQLSSPHSVLSTIGKGFTSSQELALFILAQLDRLSSCYWPLEDISSDANHPVSNPFAPLSIEITRQAILNISELLYLAFDRFSALEGDIDSLEQQLATYPLISSLRLLRSHLYQVSRCVSSAQAREAIVDKEHRIRLREQFLKLVDIESEGATKSQVVQESLAAFSAGMSILYPNSVEQQELLQHLMNEDAKGDLSNAEKQLLGSLLHRMSDVGYVNELVGGSNIESGSEVLTMLLNVANDDTLRIFEELKNGNHPKIVTSGAVLLLESSLKLLFAKASIAVTSEEEFPSILQRFSSIVCTNCVLLFDKAQEVNKVLLGDESASGLHPSVDLALSTSASGTLLPLLSTCFILLGQQLHQKSESIKKETADELRSLLSNFMTQLPALLTCVGNVATTIPNEGLIVSTEMSKGSEMQVLESLHPYLNDTEQVFNIAIPNAVKYTITFQPGTVTEAGYDFIRFYKDESRSSYWGEDKYSGSQWAGLNGSSPLEIPAPSFLIYWKTDSSGTEHGWTMHIVAETREVRELRSLHWIPNLANSLASVGSTASMSTFNATTLSLLEKKHGKLLESKILRTGLNESRDGTEFAFLQDLVEHDDESDSPAGSLAKTMKGVVVEDVGHLRSINQAVWATIAALIHHNGLSISTLKYAESLAAKQSATPPEGLVKIWRAGQKMRQWVSFGAPSEMTDEFLENRCKQVIERGKFLCSVCPMSGPATSATTTAKSQWKTLANLTALQRQSSLERRNSLRLAHVVQEAKAAQEVQRLFDFKREAARRLQEQQKGKHFKSDTELVLEFVQSDLTVEELQDCLQRRDKRALERSQAFELLFSMLSSSRGKSTMFNLLGTLALMLRNGVSKQTEEEKEISIEHDQRTHYMADLEGCSLQTAKSVEESFGKLLKDILSRVWGDQIDTGLVSQVIKAISFDVDLSDQKLLVESGLLAELSRYTQHNVREATSFFRVIALRLVGLEGQIITKDRLSQITSCQQLIIDQIFSRLASSVERVQVAFEIEAPAEEEEKQVVDESQKAVQEPPAPICTLVSSPTFLARQRNIVVPHVDLKLQWTIAMWVFPLPVESGEGVKGGVLFNKGTRGLLTPEELAVTWSWFQAQIDDGGLVSFKIGHPGSDLPISAHKPLAASRWSHVAFTLDSGIFSIIINGEVDNTIELPADFVNPGGSPTSLVIESPHPYDNDSNIFTPVSFPGATRLHLSFSADTVTESGCDYVVIYRDSSHSETWGEQYSGENWPREGNPLTIESDSFEFHFHSDGSVNAWGYKLTVSADVAQSVNPDVVLNNYPFYLGNMPVWADKSASSNPADVILGSCAIYSTVLSERQIRKFLSSTEAKPLLPTNVHESSLLSTSALLRVCSRSLLGKSAIQTSRVINPLLTLFITECGNVNSDLLVQIATLRLCERVLPECKPEDIEPVWNSLISDASIVARRGEDEIAGLSGLSFVGFLEILLVRVLKGQLIVQNNGPCFGRLGADGAFALVVRMVELVRALCVNQPWNELIKNSLREGLASAAALYSEIRSSGCGAPTNLEQAALAGRVSYVLSVLGGEFEGLIMGTPVKVSSMGDEKGTIVYVARSEQHAKVLLDSKIAELGTVDVRLADLSYSSRVTLEEFYASISEIVQDEFPLIVKDLLSLNAIATVEAVVKRQVEKRVMIESTHPYQNNADNIYPVQIAGAESITLTFDEETRTEDQEDYVTVLRPEGQDGHFGDEKYFGRGSERHFPGLDGIPPLVVPGSCCRLLLRSDGEGNDYGFKVYATATVEEEISANEAFPTSLSVTLSQLQARITQALQRILEYKQYVAYYTSALPSLITLATSSKKVGTNSSAKSSVEESLESPHPYSNNMDQSWPVNIPGATRITITFSPETRTEHSCDWLCFYRDESRSAVWGENRYTGRDSNQNWPGLQGRPPLEIESDSFIVYFHSDGSETDWGWRINMVAEMSGSGSMSISNLSRRAFRLSQLLYEQPKGPENFNTNIPIQAPAPRIPVVANLLSSKDKSDESARAFFEPDTTDPKSIKKRNDMESSTFLVEDSNTEMSLLNIMEVSKASSVSAPYNPQSDLQGSLPSLTRIAHETYTKLSGEISLLAAVQIISQWPNQIPFNLESLGSIPFFLEFLTFVKKAQNLGDDQSSIDSLADFRKKLQAPLQSEQGESLASTVIGFVVKRLSKCIKKMPSLKLLETREIESTHPYENNENRNEEYRFPGANRLKIEFDPQTRLENSCDTVHLSNLDRTENFGTGQFTGRDGSGKYPGINGEPPLWVNADSMLLRFTTDGSVTDWGYKIIVSSYVLEEEKEESKDDPESEQEEDKSELDEKAIVDVSVWLVQLLIDSVSDPRIARIVYCAPLLQVLRKLAIQNEIDFLFSILSLIRKLLSPQTTEGKQALLEVCQSNDAFLHEFVVLKDSFVLQINTEYEKQKSKDSKTRSFQIVVECLIGLLDSIDYLQSKGVAILAIQDEQKDDEEVKEGEKKDTKLAFNAKAYKEVQNPVLRFTKGNTHVTHIGREQVAASATAAYPISSGVHSWNVTIFKAQKQEISIGVSASGFPLTSRLGLDDLSWGWSHGTLQHCGRRLTQQRIKTRNGDVIGVQLDADKGILKFKRNGAELGAAVFDEPSALSFTEGAWSHTESKNLGATELTLEFWVRLVGASQKREVLCIPSVFALEFVNKTIKVLPVQDDGTYSNMALVRTPEIDSLESNWKHVAIALGQTQIVIYVDGVQIASETVGVNLSPNAPLCLVFGLHTNQEPQGVVQSTSSLQSATIRELRIWSHFLGSDEITANSGVRLSTSNLPVGLLGYWPLDEGAGDVLHDLTNGMGDMTLHNLQDTVSGYEWMRGATADPGLRRSALDVSTLLSKLPLFPAVTLCDPGDEVSIQFASEQKEEEKEKSQLDLPQWFNDVRDAIKLIGKFAKNKRPDRLLMKYILPTIATKSSLTLESSHPFNNVSVSELIQVSLAQKLEFRFSKFTRMNEKDVIRISSPDGKQSSIVSGDLTSNSVIEYGWDRNHVNPTASISADSQVVKRTTSSGWTVQCASRVYTMGRHYIAVRGSQSSGGFSAYVGVVEEGWSDTTSPLDHGTSWAISAGEHGFKAQDVIGILIDMRGREAAVSFFSNGEPVTSYRHLPKRLQLAVSMGGNDTQSFSILTTDLLDLPMIAVDTPNILNEGVGVSEHLTVTPTEGSGVVHVGYTHAEPHVVGAVFAGAISYANDSNAGYFEVTITQGSPELGLFGMFVGLTSTAETLHLDAGLGTVENKNSFAVNLGDGSRVKDNTDSPYMPPCDPGDVVGVLINFVQGKITYARNGELIGSEAFDGVTPAILKSLTPAVALSHPGQQVELRVCGPFRYDLKNDATLNSLASDRPAELSVGDRVVRGPDWESGEQDGGSGTPGTVIAFVPYHTTPRKGVSVMWDGTDRTFIYRWGYEGAYDVTPLAVESRNDVVVIEGNEARFEVIAANEGENFELEPVNVVLYGFNDSVNVEGDTVTSSGRFPTVAVRDVMLTSGKWYYEARIEQEGLGQIGWADASYRGNSSGGEGVGDDRHSWGYDGNRVLSWFSGSRGYGERWSTGDVIGFAADIDNKTLSFSRNGNWSSPMGVAFTDIEFDRGLFPALTMQGSLQLRVNMGQNEFQFAPPSDDYQSVYMGMKLSNSSSPWGYQVKVVPHFPEAAELTDDMRSWFEENAKPYYAGWKPIQDSTLIRYINDVSQQRNISLERLLRCTWSDLEPSEQDLKNHPTLAAIPALPEEKTEGQETKEETNSSAAVSAVSNRSRLEARFKLLQQFNSLLHQALPLIDFSSGDSKDNDPLTSSCIAVQLSGCRHLIFGALKNPIWERGLEQTRTPSSSEFDLRLSRSRASKHASTGFPDNEGRQMLFSQAFRHMHEMPPSRFRHSNKLYNTVFMGEMSHDAGGPYRESFTAYCAELQSPALPLLIPCPNQSHAVGQNREKWVPNPGSTSAVHLKMYSFLGKLMVNCFYIYLFIFN